MNVRVLAAISVLANVALVAVALRAGRGPAAGATDAVASSRASASEALHVKTNLTRVEMTETNEAPPFHWRTVQSDDLKVFATNLFDVGCPPETVRAILESEAWEQYLPRRRALLEPFHRQYWDLAASGPNIEKASEATRESVDKLKEETLGKLDAIIGEKSEPENERRVRNAQLDFLSDEKQRALEELEKKFGEETRKLREAKGGKMTPELKAEMQTKGARLAVVRREAIRALMTPDENAEYELRHSSHTAMAQSSAGFEATPAEAREVTRIYQQFAGADVRTDKKDPDFAAKKAQAAAVKSQRDEALKQTLGGERYAEFNQGLNSTFQQVYQITERYGLPREQAAQASQVLNTWVDAQRLLRADKSLSREERMAREQAMQVETRLALLGAIGERALRTYEKYQGPIVPQPKQGEVLKAP